MLHSTAHIGISQIDLLISKMKYARVTKIYIDQHKCNTHLDITY